MFSFKKIFKPRPKPSEWEWRYTQFKQRVAAMPADDPFWPTFLDLLDKFKDEEVDKLCEPNIGNDEANRCRGRIGMLLDLKNDLAALPDKARAEVDATVKKTV